MPCQYWIYGCTIVSKTRFYVKENITFIYIHLKLDLVNVVVRPLLFTKLSLFTKSSLDKE